MKKLLFFLLLMSGFMVSEAQVSCSNTCNNISLEQFRNESLRLINNYRESRGKEKLIRDQFLEEAAQNYVEWCVRNIESYNFDAHGADGTTPEERVSKVIDLKAGAYDFKSVGENIARGHRCAKEYFEAWKSSTTHNWQMLYEEHEFVGFGIACYDGNFIAAQVFGNNKFKKSAYNFRFNDDFTYNLNNHTYSFSFEASKEFAKKYRNIQPFLEYRIYDEYGKEWNYGGIGSLPLDMGVSKIEKKVEVNQHYPTKRVKSGYKMKIRYFDGSGYQEKFYNIGEPVNFVDITANNFVKEFSLDKNNRTATIITERQNQEDYIRIEIKYDGFPIMMTTVPRSKQEIVMNFYNRVKKGNYELWIQNRLVKSYIVR